jgi:hypothetical protein
MILIGIISVGFDITDQLLIRFFVFLRFWKNDTVHQLFTLNKAYGSVRSKEFYNFLTESGISMKLVWLTKICLNDTYYKVHISKYCGMAPKSRIN